MKFLLCFTVSTMVFAIIILNAEAVPTTLPPTNPSSTDPSLNDPSSDPSSMIEHIRNKRDVMIYDWGCEDEACDRDCKGRDFKSGHCTPYALINVRCWCVPK